MLEINKNKDQLQQSEKKHREITPETVFQDQSLKKWHYETKKMEGLIKQKTEEGAKLKSSGSADFEKEDSKLKRMQNALTDIKTGNFNSKRTNGNRIFNPLVNMSKEMRRYVSLRDSLLVEIDCTNSHPLLLIHKLMDEGVKIEQELINIVEEGKFYEIFKGDREEIKQKVFTFFYNRKEVNPKHPIYAELKSRFPIFAEAVAKYSKEGSLAFQLQMIEAKIWIDTISRACRYAKVPHVTTHDGIVFEGDTEEKINFIESIVRQAYDKIKPKLHIETLDKQPVGHNYTENESAIEYVNMAKAVNGENIDDKKRLMEKVAALSQYFNLGFMEFNLSGNKTDVYFKDHPAIEFLKKRGYYSYKLVEGLTFLKITNNVVKEVSSDEIKKEFTEFIDELPDRTFGYSKKALKDIFHGRLGKSLKPSSHFEYLDRANHKLENNELDGPEHANIPFNNGVLKITKEGRKLIPFEEFDKLIWEGTIKKLDYSKADVSRSNSEIARYFYNVSGINIKPVKKYEGERIVHIAHSEKQDDFRGLKQIAGYLIHRYKDPAEAKMIVIMDKYTDKSDSGGAGKTLFSDCIGIVRNLVKLDGKSEDKSFTFDGVTHDTELVSIDDIVKFYKFEKLNTLITGDLYVNPKYGKKMKLPFKIAPKLIATSNYMIDTDHPGIKRRVIMHELNDHYNTSFTPLDDFGHRLIDDWDEEQMNIEINFLIECLEDYLTYGMPKSNLTDETEKHLRLKHGDEEYEALCELVEEFQSKGAGYEVANHDIKEWVCELMEIPYESFQETEKSKHFLRRFKSFLDAKNIKYMLKSKVNHKGSTKRGRGYVFN